MDDPFLMGVLHRLANGNEQFQAFAGRQVLFVTELRDGNSIHQFHHEVGSARVPACGCGGTCV